MGRQYSEIMTCFVFISDKAMTEYQCKIVYTQHVIHVNKAAIACGTQSGSENVSISKRLGGSSSLRAEHLESK